MDETTIQPKSKDSTRASKSRVEEISIVDNFKLGYRNREDITNLPPGVLVVGSKNILVNTASRLQAREGYVLDGDSSTLNAPILSSFEWNTKLNGKRIVRFGFLTSAGSNGKLQFRYTNSTGGVVWASIATGISNRGMNFTTFWNTTELLREMLYVNGNNNIYEWNGAFVAVNSVASGMLTLASSVATTGFYNSQSAKFKILDTTNATGGLLYTYTGATGSVLSGVSPNPQLSIASGDVIVQAPYTYPLTSATGGPASTYNADLISTLLNQVFIGSLASPTFYMSKTNNYGDYSMSSPRIPADGATGTLDDNIVGFIPQEDVMYITAGKDFWYNTKLEQTSVYNGAAATPIITETFQVKLLKLNNLQAGKSQALINNTGNRVIMVQNEPAFDVLGRMADILQTPQTHNLSDPIKNDFDTYDFTGGSVYSWRRYDLIAIPVEGIVLIYNKNIKAWESPQTLPISSFYTLDGDLYGHSGTTSESYKLFTGYSDRVINGVGSPILANANFSYQNYGTRTALKSGNEFYMEGYISGNTTLTGTINYEVDGCMTSQSFEVDGSDTTVVCVPTDDSSFGKVSFGKEKFGGDKSASLTGLPPKFRVIKTFPRIDFYEHQFTFNIYGKDQNFQIIGFGSNSSPSNATNSAIKQ